MSDAQPSPASDEQALATPVRIRQVKHAALRARHRHPKRLAGRAGAYRRRVGEFAFGAKLEEIRVPVQGNARRPYTVRMAFDPGRKLLQATCTCPYSMEVSECKHTWAALDRLVEELDALAAGERLRARDVADAALEGGKGGKGGKDAQEGQGGALRRLDRLLADFLGEPSEEPPAGRVVWRVAVDDGVSVEPYEQRRRDDGSYSAGRKVSLERLSKTRELWTRPDLRAIAAAVRRVESRSHYGRYRQVKFVLDPRAALAHLVGCPQVYWRDRPQQRVRVRRAELGLVLEPVGEEQVQLRPVLGERPLPPGMRVGAAADLLVVADTKANVLSVGSATGQGVALVQRLAREPLVFPRRDRDALLARVESLETLLPVRLPDLLVGEPRDADGRLRLQCTFREAGLRVAARVRPHADVQAQLPGGGPPLLAQVLEGRRVAIRRDLEAERRAARGAARELELDARPELSSWTWQLGEEEALDLLSRLRARAREDLLVEWPEGEALRVTREAVPADLQVRVDDRRDWFGIEGALLVDGHHIALNVLLTGLREGRRYLPLGEGRWLKISELLRERLQQLAELVRAVRGQLELGPAAAPALQEVLDDAGAVELSAGWRALEARLQAAAAVDPTPPRTLQAELRPYQRDGFVWLKRLATWGVGACLADDMGLGKTVQAIAMLLERAELGPALVVAPTSVGFNWERELRRFAPSLRATQYRDAKRAALLEGAARRDVIIVSYDLARIDAEGFQTVRWATLVLDEAQHVKNPATKTAQALRAFSADWRLGLSGTPVENHLGELWSLFRLLSPGLLGTWTQFRERFSDPIERQGDAERRRALARLIRPFVLRRTKAEVLSDLPARTEVRLDVSLSQAERERYDAVRLAAAAELSGVGAELAEQRFNVLAALTRLRQLACHPRLLDPGLPPDSAKLRALLELSEELRRGGHRALVFSQFTSYLQLIRQALEDAGLHCLYLDGSVPARERARRVDAFQAGEGDLFLISLKAGGQGLNLTAADYVIHMDPWWNPAAEDQATDRAHRIGQTRPVTVFRLVALGTIEEQILELHADKRDLVAGVLEGADRAARLSLDELVGLIREGAQEAARDVPEPLPSGASPAPASAPAAAPSERPGDRLKRLRRARGLSQRALGQELGVSQSRVSQWERGLRVPDPGVLARLEAWEQH